MILLDTHAFVWLASTPELLSKQARSVIEMHMGDLALSIVSSWEIALLVKKERLVLPVSVEDFIERALERHAVEELPLSRSVILDVVNLEPIHNDPFDRILIAEANCRGCAIITKDRWIPQYPVKTVW